MKRVLSFVMALVLTLSLVSMADLSVLAAVGVPDAEREIKIEIAKYKVGEPIPQVPQVTLYMPGTITEIAWSSDYTGTFEDWGRYSFHMTLEAPEGQTFTSGDIQHYNVANSWFFSIQYSDDGKQVYLNLGVETSYYRCYNANIDAVLDNLQPGEVFTPNVYLLSGAVETMYVQWVDPVSKQGVNELQMGNTYCVDMALRPAEYFRFSESFNVEVCNVPLEWKFPGSEVVIVSDQELHIYIPYLFAEEIEALQVTASEPQIGMAFSELTAAADSTAELESIRVHDGYTGQLLEEGTFREGYLYSISYVFTPAAGYKFADFVALEVETPYSYSWSTDERELYFDYYYQEGGEAVSNIEIEAPIPTPGTSTDDYVLEAPEGAPYIIQYVGWNDLTVDDYNPREFTENHRYLMVLDMFPAPGYCFDGDMQILINGQEARWSGGVDGAHIAAETVVSLVENEQYIDYAEVQIDGIKPGGKTEEVVVTIPEDAPYTIQEIFVQDTEDWNRVDVFNKDGQYRVGVTLQPKEGYVFAEKMDGAVNGQPYRPWTFNYGAGTEFGYDVSFTVDRVQLSELPYEIREGAAEIPVIEETYGQAEITGIRWLDAAKEPVSQFVPGQAYYLAVELSGKGYRTFREGELQLQLQNYIPYEITYTKEKTAVILFKYADLLPAIDMIHLDLPVPRAGMDIRDLIPQNEQLKLTSFSVYYYEQDFSLQEGVIEENGTYQVYMCFAPAGENQFADDMQLVIKDDFPYAVEHGHIASELNVYYTFSTKETIPTVQIDATMPVPNMRASDCTVSVPEGAPYTIETFSWNDMQTDAPAEIFEAEGEYRLFVRLAAQDGYTFDWKKTTALLNGKEVDWNIEDGGRTLCIYYWHNFRIERVMLGELPYIIEPGKAIIPQVECLSQDVTVTGVVWMDSEKYLPVTEFEEGKAYYLAVAMKAAEGKIFYLTDEFYIEHWNGATQDFSPIDNDKIIAYFRYSLEPSVERVDITVPEVQVGMPAQQLLDGITVDGARLEWTSVIGTEYGEMVETIEPNKNYYIDVAVTPPAGYRLEDTLFFVNGEENYDWHHNGTGRICRIFVSTKEKVSTIELTMPKVELGKNLADTLPVAPEGAPYTLVGAGWELFDQNGWAEVSGGTFQKGLRYRVVFSFRVADGYAFDKNTVCRINGKEPDDFFIYQDVQGGSGNMEFSFCDPIARVELPAFPDSTLKKGQTLSTKDYTVPEDAPYTLIARWIEINGGEKTKVDENGIYLLTFVVQPKPGYEFTNSTKFYMDGKEYLPLERDITGAYCIQAYPVGKKTIDRIDLTVDMPVSGGKPGNISIPKDAKYAMSYFDWLCNDSGELTYADFDVPTVFKEGMYAFFSLNLDAEEGYSFTKDTVIYMNGEKIDAAAAINIGTQLVIAHCTGRVGSVSSKLTAPKVSVEEETLTWAAVAGADGYEIYRSTKKSSGFKKIDTVTETAFFDQDAAAGKTYYYKVKAIYNANSKFNSSDSKVVSVDYKLAAPEISTEMNLDTGKTVITWEKVSGAKSYNVYRATDVDGKYTKLGNTKSLSYTDSKAVLGVEYYYKVVAVASKSKYNSGYSNIYMSYAILGRPDVDIDIDEASGKPALSWKKVSGAVGYRILRKLNGAAEYEILAEITERSFADSTAPLDSTCEYRVVALHENEYLHSAYSKAVEATVTFGRPAVKGSINGEGQPVLTWNAIDGALKYEVLRSTKSSKGYALIATATEGTAYTDETATPGKTYYYQVVAVGENTKSKASSAVKLTGTCAAPVVDIQTDPETGRPKLTWEKVNGAKSYDVYYATSANGKYKKLGNTKNLSYTDTKIAIGATRYYKVVAVGSKKAYNSPMSNMVAGMGFCAAPDVKTKVDAATGKPELSWKKVSGASSYRIFRILSTEGGDFVEIANISKTTFIDTTAPIDTKCIYMVQAMHKSEGLSSAFSAPVEVTSGIAQPKLSAGLNSDGQPRFNWQLVEGAVKYEIYRSTKSATKGFTLYAVKEDGNAFFDTDVAAGKTYYYKVVAVGAVGKSAESAVVKLTATCAVPVASADLDITSGRPVITWEKISGAKKYEVWRATSADGKYKKVGTTSKTEYVDTGASVGGTYYYKVKAIGSKKSYNSDLSAATEGITAFLAQPKVTVKTDSKGMPVVSWKKVSGASKYYVLYVDVSDYLYDENVDEATLQEYIENNLQYVEVSSKKTSVTLTDTQLGRLYMVYVIAAYKNEAFSSAMSEPQIIDRCCVAPKIKVSMVEGYNGATWNPVEGAEFYIVYRSTKKSSGYVELGSVEGNGFIDGSAVKGKTYYYKVAACTMHSEDTFITISADSNVIKIKTKK